MSHKATQEYNDTIRIICTSCHIYGRYMECHNQMSRQDVVENTSNTVIESRKSDLSSTTKMTIADAYNATDDNRIGNTSNTKHDSKSIK